MFFIFYTKNMWDFSVDYILDKYGNIIQEEINVKEIKSFSKDIQIAKVFKPLGSALSSKFGKDTWNIIKYGKMWNIVELADGQIKVFDDQDNHWILSKEDYEISYEGLDGDDVAIDGGVITKLDLEITPELEMEWVAREISRFLNQMRKDANYNVDDKIMMFYSTESEYMLEVLKKFSSFLIDEALLLSIENSQKDWDIVSNFTMDQSEITFSLKK